MSWVVHAERPQWAKDNEWPYALNFFPKRETSKGAAQLLAREAKQLGAKSVRVEKDRN